MDRHSSRLFRGLRGRKRSVDGHESRERVVGHFRDSFSRIPVVPVGIDTARGLDPMIIRPIAGGVEVFAPAKLNLFLEVLGRRPDGYHEIETVMIATSLYDGLTIHDDPSGEIRLRCNDPTLPVDGENLVIKAADRLKAATGCPRGARFELTKAIPAQAGLAGGSSDAAATLAGLDRVWDLGLSREALDAIAAEVGSDVAFFNHVPAAVCRGRGERVEAVSLNDRYNFVLVCPPVGVSTAEVYRKVVPPERPRPVPSWRPWRRAGRRTSAGACSTGYNLSPKRSGPN